MPREDGTGPIEKGKGYSGPEFCVCPKCNAKAKHIRGQSCNQQKCPKCGFIMTRGD